MVWSDFIRPRRLVLALKMSPLMGERRHLVGEVDSTETNRIGLKWPSRDDVF